MLAVWNKLVAHWTGERSFLQQSQKFFSTCASRRIVSIPVHWKALLANWTQENWEAADGCESEIWHILAMTCQIELLTD